MIKTIAFYSIWAVILGCQSTEKSENKEEMNQTIITDELIDSLIYFREGNIKTDFLSRKFLGLDRKTAIEIQLAMLNKELANGQTQIGWKMGGTAGDDTSKYDPAMGYMLSNRQHAEGDVISISNFPGKEVLIEGELGFKFNKDLPKGATSIEEIKNAIEYVIPAVEFAQSNALPIIGNPDSQTINHTLAFGMGQAGSILGEKTVSLSDFNLDKETLECFIDGKLIAQGGSSRIMGGHLKALYNLANLLAENGSMIKKGQVVISGSMYINPKVTGNAKVQLRFSTLGNIDFEIKE